jgi:tetratricopeptide (TPR) repeat protein/tRNA A-37 threonylcarbamoyl transferase component Bud32
MTSDDTRSPRDDTITATRGDHDGDEGGGLDSAHPIRLGRYVLLQRLGQGAMGVVYAAYDEQLDRKVAIKLLRSRGGEHAQLRLAREAQALARLSHPNVVQIYEIAEASHAKVEQAYLVMEFIDGMTLGRWLADRQRSRAEILEVFTAAGRGLAAAHAVSLVHRDFKPDNVMIRSDGRVLVTDFGLAYADTTLHASAPDLGKLDPDIVSSSKLSEHLTATGAMTGTPAYMAPEQFLGLGTDAQTDQFGFCIALWEALYGKRPFVGRDVAAISMAVTEGDITKPERDDLPSWLRLVLERGLAREPRDRWPTMQALLDALARDPTRRRRSLIAAAVAITLVLVSAIAMRLDQQHVHAEQIAICQAEGQAITADWNDEVRAALERDFLATKLELADSAWQSTRTWMDAYVREWTDLRTRTCLAFRVEHTRTEDSHARVVECLDERRAAIVGLARTWSSVDRQTLIRAPMAATALPPLSACTNEASLARQIRPPEHSRERVAVLRDGLEQANALRLAAKFQPALDQAQLVLRDAEALGWQPLVAETRLLIGLLHEDLGEPELAVTALQRAALEAIASGHDMIVVEVAYTLTWIVGERFAKYDEGLLWGQLALGLITRLELTGTTTEADVLASVAAVHEAAGELDEALAAERRALSIREAAYGSDHPQVAASLDRIGGVLSAKGQHDDALLEFRRALAIREAALGPEHVEIAHSHNSIGGVHMRQAKLDDALASFQRAHEIVIRGLGPDHIELAPSYNNIGVIHWQRGNHAEALIAFEHAQTIQEKVLGPNHPHVASALDNIGNVLVSQGSHEPALAAHERALAIRETTLGPDHADVAASLNNLGGVLIEVGREDEALAAFQRAQAIWSTALDPDHPYVASAMTNVADVSGRRGQHADALAIYPRALVIFETSLGPDHPYVAYPLIGMGRSRRALGELVEARSVLERALAIRTATLGPPAELAEVRFELARVAWEEGGREAGRELAGVAREGYREAGLGSEDELAAIDAWMVDHP